MFFAIPMVREHRLLPAYLLDKAHDEESKANVERLLAGSIVDVSVDTNEKPWMNYDDYTDVEADPTVTPETQ